MTAKSCRKIFGGLVILTTALIVLASVKVTSASSPKLGTNWRVFNIEPSTNFFWDIDRPQANPGGLLQFPIQPFQSISTGSFVVYLYNNYNYNLTGSTLTADAMWPNDQYVTRGPASDGAYVRFEFQDVSDGPYTANDYWWSTGTNIPGTSLNLNTTNSGTLHASLADRSLWSNLCGKFANDTSAPYTDCITGSTLNVSPSEGFTRALKKVKEVGLSFGRASRYASGVAAQSQTEIFVLNDFTITPPAP